MSALHPVRALAGLFWVDFVRGGFCANRGAPLKSNYTPWVEFSSVRCFLLWFVKLAHRLPFRSSCYCLWRVLCHSKYPSSHLSISFPSFFICLSPFTFLPSFSFHTSTHLSLSLSCLLFLTAVVTADILTQLKPLGKVGCFELKSSVCSCRATGSTAPVKLH